MTRPARSALPELHSRQPSRRGRHSRRLGQRLQCPRALRPRPERRIVLWNSYSSVFTSMSGSHKSWQVLECGIPLTTARHSKQIPMPHKGPRGSAITELRQGCPAITIATATVAPAGTETDTPFTRTMNSLGMGVFLCRPRRKIRLDSDLRFRARHLIYEKPRGSKRCRNSQAFVTGRKKHRFVPWTRTDKWQFVRGRCAKTRPYAHCCHGPERRHIFLRATHHVRQHDLIDFLVLSPVLPRRANQNLPGPPRLDIESYGNTRQRVRTLEITKFD